MIIGIFSQADDAEGALNNLAEADFKTSNISVVMATKEQVCTPGYAKAVRNVPEEEKDEVYAEYGVTHHSPGEYEVDHHVSLELGG